jgi:hypothetical protein
MIYGSGPWQDAEDWVDSICELFGLSLAKGDINAAVERARLSKVILFDSTVGQYRLHPDVEKVTCGRIEAGEYLERSAQASWLKEIESLVPEIQSEALWSCLLGYAGKVFLAHGADAVTLLGGKPESIEEIPDGRPDVLLKEAMDDAGIGQDNFFAISSAIAVFFDGTNDDRAKYVMELTDSTFNFLALGLDEETRASVRAQLPSLTIFVDTNVIYGAIGAHSSSQSASSADLVDVLHGDDFGFSVYYHERTLRELENTIVGIGYRLRASKWSPAMSRARLSVPFGMSSIETRYHEINAEIPTPVDVFLSRYANLPVLLESYGFKMFREASSEELDRRRAELVAEYRDFEQKKRRRGVDKRYEALDHDIAIWLAASRRQVRGKGRSLLSSGALVVTADHLFQRFDREILSTEFGNGTWVTVAPDRLLQALRPFLKSTEAYDKAFARIFATSVFRGLSQDYGETLNRVAAYLATYESMPEETAARILANSMLLSRINDSAGDGDELKRIVDEEIVRENEALIHEREQAVADARRERLEASREVSGIRERISFLENQLVEEGRDSEVIMQVKGLAGALEDLDAKFVIEGGLHVVKEVNNYSGGYFDNDNTVIAGQGRDVRVKDATQQVVFATGLATDTAKLIEELDAVRKELVRLAERASDYEAVAEIEHAREAGERSDQQSLFSHLRKAGTWALEAAKRLGLSVAEDALRQAIGIGS